MVSAAVVSTERFTYDGGVMVGGAEGKLQHILYLTIAEPSHLHFYGT
jgi:hypothetical protein